MLTYHEDLITSPALWSFGVGPVCYEQQHHQQHCRLPEIHAVICLPKATSASYTCCPPVPHPHSSLRENLEQAMEMHGSIKSPWDPLPWLLRDFLLSASCPSP